MAAQWVVLLEAVDARDAGGVTWESVQRLIGCLASYEPSGLYSGGRYAVQVIVPAAKPEVALARALAEWRRAAAATEFPEWELVRGEVKTLAELEAEHRQGGHRRRRSARATCRPARGTWVRAVRTSPPPGRPYRRC